MSNVEYYWIGVGITEVLLLFCHGKRDVNFIVVATVTLCALVFPATWLYFIFTLLTKKPEKPYGT